jgi:hypothetical protein
MKSQTRGRRGLAVARLPHATTGIHVPRDRDQMLHVSLWQRRTTSSVPSGESTTRRAIAMRHEERRESSAAGRPPLGAIARAEAMRGSRDTDISAPTLCVCNGMDRRGLAARMLLAQGTSHPGAAGYRRCAG